jgi:hypothetical protein
VVQGTQRAKQQLAIAKIGIPIWRLPIFPIKIKVRFVSQAARVYPSGYREEVTVRLFVFGTGGTCAGIVGDYGACQRGLRNEDKPKLRGSGNLGDSRYRSGGLKYVEEEVSRRTRVMK